MNLLKIFIISLFLSSYAEAAPRIAVLNFELNDYTSLPNTQQERKRTASIQPLLVQALANTGNVDIVPISQEDQQVANSSFGYLFRFHDLAAKLGARHGADWIIVGQHSKPSFLYSYLIAQVIQVDKQILVAQFAIELKGNHEKVTQRGVLALAHKIHELMGKS